MCQADAISTLDRDKGEVVGWLKCDCGEADRELWRIPYKAESNLEAQEQLDAE